MTDWQNRPKIDVKCLDSGESQYIRPSFKPLAGCYRAVCPCDCGAAEYREPEAL